MRERGKVALELLRVALGGDALLHGPVELGVDRCGEVLQRRCGGLHREPRVAAGLALADEAGHAAQLHGVGRAGGERS